METILREITDFVKNYSIDNLKNAENLMSALSSALHKKMKIRINYDLKKYYPGSDISFVTTCEKKEHENYIYSGYVFVLSSLTQISPIDVKLLNFPVSNPYAIQFTPKIKDMLKDGYRVYPMLDGIKVSMYYNKNTLELNYATKNSVDIKDMEWRDYVYNALFEEAELENNVVSGFNKDYVYNCVIYNNKIHYMKYSDKITNITILNVYDAMGNPVLLDQWQQPLDITYDEMLATYTQTKQNVDKYFAGKKDNIDEDKKFVGYILRHPDREREVYSLPSNMYDHIRNLIYDSATHLRAKFSSTNYMLLVNFINLSNRNKFMKLFPEKSYQMDVVKNLISVVTDRIYYKFITTDPDYEHIIGNLPPSASQDIRKKIEGFNHSINDQTEIFVNFLYNSVKSYSDMKFVADMNVININRDIIWNMVVDPRNINHLYECF